MVIYMSVVALVHAFVSVALVFVVEVSNVNFGKTFGFFQEEDNEQSSLKYQS